MNDLVHYNSPVAPVSLIARVLTLDPRTIQKGMDAGEIPFVPIGRRRMVPLKPFLALLGLEWVGANDGK
jgi:hypothetical protein